MNANLAKGFKVFHLADGDGDQLVNSGRCYLHTITINTLAVGKFPVQGDLFVLDGVTNAGVPVANIHVDTATGSPPVTLIFDVEMNTGIFLDHDGNLAGYDFTVTYL